MKGKPGAYFLLSLFVLFLTVSVIGQHTVNDGNTPLLCNIQKEDNFSDKTSGAGDFDYTCFVYTHLNQLSVNFNKCSTFQLSLDYSYLHHNDVFQPPESKA